MNTEMIETIRNYFSTQPVLKAWLFGSFARGEETPDSDVDILVLFDKKAKVSLIGQATMMLDLEDLPCQCDEALSQPYFRPCQCTINNG